MDIDQQRRSTQSSDGVLLTAAQAAKLLNIQPATLASWRLSGRTELAYVRVGRCVRYRRADITDFIEQHITHNVRQVLA
jgi:excisionase family DNA binding protein